MRFADHGEYRILVANQVAEIHIFGHWNEQVVETFFGEVAKIVDTFNGKPFATIVDLRLWELGTPEALAAVVNETYGMIERGLKCEAFVMGESSIQQGLTKSMTPQAKGYERKYCKTNLEGFIWLADKGFRIY